MMVHIMEGGEEVTVLVVGKTSEEAETKQE